MNTITREQKRERFLDYMNFFEYKGREFDDDIDAAILADYAPLTEERRHVLKLRKCHLEMSLLPDDDGVPVAGHVADVLRHWLAEIDAELEGDDG